MVEFITAKGTQISVALIGKGLVVSVNGKRLAWNGVQIVTHAVQGSCLNGIGGKDFIPLPANKIDAVRLVLADYAAQIAAFVAANQDGYYDARGNQVRSGSELNWR